MRFSTRRNHLDTLEWAQEVENGSVAEKNGILGKSILFQVPGFDVIQDLLPEAMHLLDAGFMKNTCGRTFNQGKSPQTRSTYRRAPVEELSKRLR